MKHKAKSGLRIFICLMFVLAVISFTVVFPASAAAQQPTYGGTLKIILGNSPRVLGYPPMMRLGHETVIVSPALEGLIATEDKAGASIPWLATAWKISAAPPGITFTLRKGVKFHDGTDFNAEAVKFNMDLNLKAKVAQMGSVKSIDVIDDYTVRVNFKTFDSQFITNLKVYPFARIASPAGIKAKGKDWARNNPVGTGPFKFVSWERDIAIKYEKFAGYWQKGKPYLDGLQFLFIADPMVASASFEAGQAQVILYTDPQRLGDLQKAGKIKVIPGTGSALGLAPSGGNPVSPFADVRVRRAISYAVDSKAITKMVGRGFYRDTNQFATPEEVWYNPNVKGYPYNPEKARELLAKAGYPKGFKTKITYISGNAQYELVYSSVQGYLRKVGIEATLEPLRRSRFAEIMYKGWDGLLLGSYAVGGSREPTTGLLRNVSDASDRYRSVLLPSDYLDMLHQVVREDDRERRIALTHEMVKLLIDEHSLINIFYMSSTLGGRYPNVHGLGMNQWHMTQYTPQDLWLSK